MSITRLYLYNMSEVSSLDPRQTKLLAGYCNKTPFFFFFYHYLLTLSPLRGGKLPTKRPYCGILRHYSLLGLPGQHGLHSLLSITKTMMSTMTTELLTHAAIQYEGTILKGRAKGHQQW